MTTRNEKVASYIMSLFDCDSGGFCFSKTSPVTTIATCYAVFALELTGLLESEENEGLKDRIRNFICSRYSEENGFFDPLLTPKSIASNEHDYSYFSEELNCFCQQALDALGYEAPCPLTSKGLLDGTSIVKLFQSYEWKNPWLDSNRVMFVLSQLCYSISRKSELLLPVLDAALNWLDSCQDPVTGVWRSSETDAPLFNSLAAWYHYGFFYTYARRRISYASEIIESAISLQHIDGLFWPFGGGHSCLDLDAIDLILRCSYQEHYYTDNIANALKRSQESILQLQQKDGGFCNNLKQRKKLSIINVLRHVRRTGFSSPKVPEYQLCWSGCKCSAYESNVFSTWFRMLALRYIDCYFDTNLQSDVVFRKLPFLGYPLTLG
ncbi:MAG: hypothetical protein KDD42_07560 [Bdellovibrionales bacterium]|nr:hypothetical protein [Bdellovibrionales bacterium]